MVATQRTYDTTITKLKDEAHVMRHAVGQDGGFSDEYGRCIVFFAFLDVVLLSFYHSAHSQEFAYPLEAGSKWSWSSSWSGNGIQTVLGDTLMPNGKWYTSMRKVSHAAHNWNSSTISKTMDNNQQQVGGMECARSTVVFAGHGSMFVFATPLRVGAKRYSKLPRKEIAP